MINGSFNPIGLNLNQPQLGLGGGLDQLMAGLGMPPLGGLTPGLGNFGGGGGFQSNAGGVGFLTSPQGIPNFGQNFGGPQGPQNPFQAGFQQGQKAAKLQSLKKKLHRLMKQMGVGGPGMGGPGMGGPGMAAAGPGGFASAGPGGAVAVAGNVSAFAGPVGGFNRLV